jgi:hypothetical protein
MSSYKQRTAMFACVALTMISSPAMAVTPSPALTFSETVHQGAEPGYREVQSISYSVTNNLTDQTVIAFAISTGDRLSSLAATGVDWSYGHQLMSEQEWRSGTGFDQSTDSYVGPNPFQSFATANPDFDSIFNGQDSNVAMYWIQASKSADMSPYFSLTPGNTVDSIFWVNDVKAASDIIAITMDGQGGLNYYSHGRLTPAVPEPSTSLLSAIGLAALLARYRGSKLG